MAKQMAWAVIDCCNGAPAKWASSRHDLQVVADCGLFRVARDGRYLRSPKGRVRSFTTLAGAQAEADVIARADPLKDEDHLLRDVLIDVARAGAAR